MVYEILLHYNYLINVFIYISFYFIFFMNIYNIDENKLSNLRITSYVILNVEYFWTDERVRKLC